jgi:glycerophosphoryl diester phosphodiesterase
MNPWPYPLWIAHRGAGKLAPENTLAAFRLGASQGYRAYECDVKLSADGQAFLLHDATLERTTNGQGLAGRLDWADLARLDAGSWHGRAYAGEPLPTLEAIAAHCRAHGHRLNIEIKPTPGQAGETGRLVALSAERLWAGTGAWPLLSSFEPEALEAARQAAPRLPLALLLDEHWNGWFEAARELGCVAIVAHHRLLDAEGIARLHAEQLRVLAYTVNDEQTAQRLLGAGIDGLITDAVDRFAPAADGLSGSRA